MKDMARQANLPGRKTNHSGRKTTVKRLLEANLNKRAQRALGRSPEEKVKGHNGANNREPQGHNLNNFGRGPFDDVIY